MSATTTSGKTIEGKNGTPAVRRIRPLEVADNDLATGEIVDGITHSPYWNDSAIFVAGDDCLTD